jgi:hypothetical protein
VVAASLDRSGYVASCYAAATDLLGRFHLISLMTLLTSYLSRFSSHVRFAEYEASGSTAWDSTMDVRQRPSWLKSLASRQFATKNLPFQDRSYTTSDLAATYATTAKPNDAKPSVGERTTIDVERHQQSRPVASPAQPSLRELPDLVEMGINNDVEGDLVSSHFPTLGGGEESKQPPRNNNKNNKVYVANVEEDEVHEA